MTNFTVVSNMEKMRNAAIMLYEAGKQEFDAYVEEARDEMIECATEALGLSHLLKSPGFKNRLTSVITVSVGKELRLTGDELTALDELISLHKEANETIVRFLELSDHYIGAP